MNRNCARTLYVASRRCAPRVPLCIYHLHRGMDRKAWMPVINAWKRWCRCSKIMRVLPLTPVHQRERSYGARDRVDHRPSRPPFFLISKMMLTSSMILTIDATPASNQSLHARHIPKAYAPRAGRFTKLLDRVQNQGQMEIVMTMPSPAHINVIRDGCLCRPGPDRRLVRVAGARFAERNNRRSGLICALGNTPAPSGRRPASRRGFDQPDDRHRRGRDWLSEAELFSTITRC